MKTDLSESLTEINWANLSNSQDSVSPANLVAVVTDDVIISGHNNKGGINNCPSLVCAGAAVADEGQREVMTPTAQCHITGVSAGPV